MSTEPHHAIELLATKIGYIVRSTRLLRGMTVEELAGRIEAPLPTIKEIERGEYTGRLDILAECFFALDYEPSFNLTARKPCL